jgi:hypothetical protein
LPCGCFKPTVKLTFFSISGHHVGSLSTKPCAVNLGDEASGKKIPCN